MLKFVERYDKMQRLKDIEEKLKKKKELVEQEKIII
jgi:hypothetical protein